MGQATIKATKRELRRAIGPSALETIQAQEQALAILSNAVASCQRDVAELAIDHATFKKDKSEHLSNLGFTILKRHEHIKAVDERVESFVGRPFLRRLRWLLTGK